MPPARRMSQQQMIPKRNKLLNHQDDAWMELRRGLDNINSYLNNIKPASVTERKEITEEVQTLLRLLKLLTKIRSMEEQKKSLYLVDNYLGGIVASMPNPTFANVLKKGRSDIASLHEKQLKLAEQYVHLFARLTDVSGIIQS